MIEECSLALPGRPAAASDFYAAATTTLDIASLVAAHSSLLFRVAHSVLRSRPEAEDVVQDTFLRVLQHQHKPHPAPGQDSIRDPRVWLIRIAWNLALDRRRRIRPDQIDDTFAATLIASTIPADQVLHESQRMQAVLHELDRLPKAERQVLLLSALDELTTPELAAITGRTESAVRALLFRARTRLRQRLDSQRPDSQRPDQGGHA
jgi:RNA polymerase sigma-70 factor (ECF subfamily)